MEKVKVLTNYNTDKVIGILNLDTDVSVFLAAWIQEDAQDAIFHDIEFWEGGSITTHEHEAHISGDNGMITVEISIENVQ